MFDDAGTVRMRVMNVERALHRIVGRMALAASLDAAICQARMQGDHRTAIALLSILQELN